MKRITAPWKGIYGTDRHFTARVDRAMERGQYTAPGTQPNPRNLDKIKRKKLARLAAAA